MISFDASINPKTLRSEEEAYLNERWTQIKNGFYMSPSDLEFMANEVAEDLIEAAKGEDFSALRKRILSRFVTVHDHLASAFNRRIMGLTPLGFSHAEVPEGTTVRVSVAPQIPFKPRLLVVDPKYAPFFEIVDIYVKNYSCSVAFAPFPASAAHPLPLEMRFFNIVGPDCPAGDPISIAARNKYGGICNFAAVIYGENVNATSKHLAGSMHEPKASPGVGPDVCYGCGKEPPEPESALGADCLNLCLNLETEI